MAKATQSPIYKVSEGDITKCSVDLEADIFGDSEILTCAIETRGGIRILREISSESLGHIVSAQRRAVLSGEIPTAMTAWQSESAQGLIEIGRDISGLEPTAGDPHMVFSRSSHGTRLDIHIEPEWVRIWSAVEAFR